MNENTADIVRSSRDFVLSINEWSAQTIMFICALLIIVIAFVNVWLFVKNTNKTGDKVLDVVDKNTKSFNELSKAIDAQNIVNTKTLEHLNKNMETSLDMHRKTHGDLSDLKWMLQGRLHDKGDEKDGKSIK